MSLLFIIPFFVGLLGLRLIPDSKPWGRLISLWLCFSFSSPYGIGMALANANTAGHTKRITTNAMYIIGAGLGSFIGPFFFKPNQEPYYTLGFDFMFVAFALEVFVLIALFVVLWMRNRKKRMARGNAEIDFWLMGQNGFLDQTDVENKEFLVCWPSTDSLLILTRLPVCLLKLAQTSAIFHKWLAWAWVTLLYALDRLCLKLKLLRLVEVLRYIQVLLLCLGPSLEAAYFKSEVHSCQVADFRNIS